VSVYAVVTDTLGSGFARSPRAARAACAPNSPATAVGNATGATATTQRGFSASSTPGFRAWSFAVVAQVVEPPNGVARRYHRHDGDCQV
jgi:hypothetical protein